MKILDSIKNKAAFPNADNVMSDRVVSDYNSQSNDGSSHDLNEIGGNAGDRVTISSRARYLSTISRVLGDDDAKRLDKMASLKKQIENGTYNVSSENIAQALLRYSHD